jgi:hypothetical protein
MHLTVNNPLPFWFEITATPVSSQEGGDVATFTLESYQLSETASIHSYSSINVGYNLLRADPNDTFTMVLSIESSSEATVVAGNIIQKTPVNVSGPRTSSVPATVTLINQKGLTVSRSVTIEVSSTRITPNIIYVDYSTGTLGSYLKSSLESALINKNETTDKALFSSTDYTNQLFTRSTNCWVSGVEGLSAFSPWNSRSANQRAGVAITKRHVLCSAHFPLSVGDTISFTADVSGQATAITRTITQSKIHPNYPSQSNSITYDLQVLLLDQDLPSSIDTLSTFPSDVIDYFGVYGMRNTPCVQFDQEKKASTSILGSAGSSTSSPKKDVPYLSQAYYGSYNPTQIPAFSNNIASNNKIYLFNEPLVTYDSGSPTCALFGNQLILLSLHTSAQGGPFIPDYIDDINQMINDVDALQGTSTGYSMTTVSLSSYPSY